MECSKIKYEVIRDLYRSCGWPSSFRKEAFLSALAVLKQEIEERQTREKEAKHPGYKEWKLLRKRQREEMEERERLQG